MTGPTLTTDGQPVGRAIRSNRPNPVRVEVVCDDAGLLALESEWERLWSEDPSSDVFASFDWFMTWWKHFGQGGRSAALVVHDGREITAVPGEGLQLHVCVVRDQSGKAVVILPLVRTCGIFKGIRGQILATAVNSHSPRAGLVTCRFDSQVVAALRETLCSGKSWDVILISGLPTDGHKSAELLTGLATRGSYPGARNVWPHAYLGFQGAWEDFLRMKGRHFRKHLGQAERALQKLGPLAVERYEGTAAAAQGLELFLSVDQASWKARDGESVARDAALRNYYSDLCRQLGQRGRVEVWILRVGGEVAAAYLCLNDGRSRYTLKTSFSEAFDSSRLSPSNVLLGRIIQESWGGGTRGVDFVGKLPFVERWANEQHFYEHAVFYRSWLWALRFRVREALGRLVNKGKAMARRAQNRRASWSNERVGAQSPAHASESRGPDAELITRKKSR